jgi:4-carboxymuconolactone decarboxylase
MDRFPPIATSDMTAAQRAVADAIATGPRGGVRGPFIPLLHNPALAGHLQALGEHLRFNTALADTLVEIAVLVTARHWSCQYEWQAHERIARKAGLADAIITSIAADRRPAGMDDDAALVHDFCIALHRRGEPDEAAYAQATERFGRSGVLDLIAVCGYYTLLAMVLNTARMPLPDGMAPPLAALPAARG